MELGSSTRRGRIAVLLAVVIACLAVPATSAAKITVPPGATEGDQYFEEVPNGKGSGSPHGGGSGGGGGTAGGGSGGGGAAGVVAADKSLRALGRDGQAAADLAEANRPPIEKGGNSSAATQQPVSSTEGGGGLGIFFPLLIAGSAVAAIAYGLRRRMFPA